MGRSRRSRTLVDDHKSVEWAPDRGEFLFANLNTQDREGHGQLGWRPVIVLTPRIFNIKFGLAVVCPVTRSGKGYPFEITIPPGNKVQGFVLADPIRTIDGRSRRVEPAGKAPVEVLERVLVVVRSFFA